MEERAVIFIDGNNFYNRMKEIGLSSKWKLLDYTKFSQKLVQGGIWEETRYYIGRVPQEGDLTSHQKQQKFFDSFQQYDNVDYFTGRIESRPISDSAKRLARWLNALPRRDDISVSEKIVAELHSIAEKRTVQYVEKAVDVMIAVDMVSMAHEGKYDVAYLITADGDYTPAVQKVKESGKRVIIASPKEGRKLSQFADSFMLLQPDFFEDCWKER